MDSKRGTLSIDEIVKLILGLAVFIFILFILFGVYNIVSGSLKQQQAKTALDNIVYEIEQLKEGDQKIFLVEGPSNWFFWSDNEKNLCFFPKSCLDNLPSRPGFTWSGDYLKTLNLHDFCKNSGFCKENIKVNIPYNGLLYDRVQGALGEFYYQSVIFRGVSGDTQHILFYQSISIDDTSPFPKAISLRNTSGGVEIFYSYVNSNFPWSKNLVDKINSIDSGVTDQMDLSKLIGKYLIVSKNKLFLCICDNYYEQEDLNNCDSEGRCSYSRIPITLRDNAVDTSYVKIVEGKTLFKFGIPSSERDRVLLYV